MKKVTTWQGLLGGEGGLTKQEDNDRAEGWRSRTMTEQSDKAGQWQSRMTMTKQDNDRIMTMTSRTTEQWWWQAGQWQCDNDKAGQWQGVTMTKQDTDKAEQPSKGTVTEQVDNNGAGGQRQQEDHSKWMVAEQGSPVNHDGCMWGVGVGGAEQTPNDRICRWWQQYDGDSTGQSWPEGGLKMGFSQLSVNSGLQ